MSAREDSLAKWHASLRDSVTTVEQLAKSLNDHALDPEVVQPAIDLFNLRITPTTLAQIRTAGEPLLRQYVPSGEELLVLGGLVDPLAEDRDSPVPNITHRYPDRVLFLVSAVCASYCRFCTRRRKVGDPEKIPLNQYEDGLAYIAQHTEIRDVALSGGDPLVLSDDRLEFLLARLAGIPHVEIVRVHTRVPTQLPERITPELCRVLRLFSPLYLNVHVNHPAEMSPPVLKALSALADAGLPLGSQTVLLKGVNDAPGVMKELMQKLLRARVRPYYIYQADIVQGAEHFITPIDVGLRIMEEIQGWTSGLAVPHFVIDAPGGGGKIPLLPNHVESITAKEIVLRNFRGHRYTYPLAPTTETND